jgi:endonuclease-3
MPPEPRYLPASGYDPAGARKRIAQIARELARTYPNPRTALTYANPFELLIATILSAQSTDETVNKTTPELFRRYPAPEDLAAADPTEVEKLIYSTGFFRQKTRSIIGCARGIVERFDGDVPRTMAEMVSLPGVARKTANVVLSSLWPRPGSDHGIFVDTHIRRVSQRLALTAHDDPVRIEQDLMDLLPRKRWWETPHQMIFLGRGPCDARRPQHLECPLLPWCPSGWEATGRKRRPRR